jgi:hypothetical protein
MSCACLRVTWSHGLTQPRSGHLCRTNVQCRTRKQRRAVECVADFAAHHRDLTKSPGRRHELCPIEAQGASLERGAP